MDKHFIFRGSCGTLCSGIEHYATHDRAQSSMVTPNVASTRDRIANIAHHRLTGEPMANHQDMPLFNLKAVVTETGLKPDTLRAWERRYGLPSTRRTTLISCTGCWRANPKD